MLGWVLSWALSGTPPPAVATRTVCRGCGRLRDERPCDRGTGVSALACRGQPQAAPPDPAAQLPGSAARRPPGPTSRLASPERRAWRGVSPPGAQAEPALPLCSLPAAARRRGDEMAARTGRGHFRASLCPGLPGLASQGCHFVRSAFLTPSCPVITGLSLIHTPGCHLLSTDHVSGTEEKTEQRG